MYVVLQSTAILQTGIDIPVPERFPFHSSLVARKMSGGCTSNYGKGRNRSADRSKLLVCKDVRQIKN